MKVIIDRSKWHRGYDGGVSALLISEKGRKLVAEDDCTSGIIPKQEIVGKKCCLGFICLAYGLSEADILGIGLPSNLKKEAKEKLPDWLRHGMEVEPLSSINDRQHTSETYREERIQELCAVHDVEIEFIG
jgi:hypothetical protein